MQKIIKIAVQQTLLQRRNTTMKRTYIENFLDIGYCDKVIMLEPYLHISLKYGKFIIIYYKIAFGGTTKN